MTTRDELALTGRQAAPTHLLWIETPANPELGSHRYCRRRQLARGVAHARWWIPPRPRASAGPYAGAGRRRSCRAFGHQNPERAIPIVVAGGAGAARPGRPALQQCGCAVPARCWRRRWRQPSEASVAAAACASLFVRASRRQRQRPAGAVEWLPPIRRWWLRYSCPGPGQPPRLRCGGRPADARAVGAIVVVPPARSGEARARR